MPPDRGPPATSIPTIIPSNTHKQAATTLAVEEPLAPSTACMANLPSLKPWQGPKPAEGGGRAGPHFRARFLGYQCLAAPFPGDRKALSRHGAEAALGFE